MSVAPAEVDLPQSADKPTSDKPWVTIVWNDPINLMSYVTYVFQHVFGYPKKKATKLMLDVHHKGRAVVAAGAREAMEHNVEVLHGYGLWATVRQDKSGNLTVEPFRPVRGGGVRAWLAAAEASLLRSLVGQVMSLVEPPRPEPSDYAGDRAGRSRTWTRLAAPRRRWLDASWAPATRPDRSGAGPAAARRLPRRPGRGRGVPQVHRAPRCAPPSTRSPRTMLDTLPADGRPGPALPGAGPGLAARR